jgi:general stress protein 26
MELMTTTTATATYPTNPILADVTAAMRKRSFCTLATSSPAHQPHVAGVIYAMVDDKLYVSTQRTSRKARNIATNPNVFVCIPIRRVPVGPPSTVQFAAKAELLSARDVATLAQAGKLKAITSHGELELADICFVRITPSERLLTYGLGLPLRQLAKDPLNAAGLVLWKDRR